MESLVLVNRNCYILVNPIRLIRHCIIVLVDERMSVLRTEERASIGLDGTFNTCCYDNGILVIGMFPFPDEGDEDEWHTIGDGTGRYRVVVYDIINQVLIGTWNLLAPYSRVIHILSRDRIVVTEFMRRGRRLHVVRLMARGIEVEGVRDIPLNPHRRFDGMLVYQNSYVHNGSLIYASAYWMGSSVTLWQLDVLSEEETITEGLFRIRRQGEAITFGIHSCSPDRYIFTLRDKEYDTLYIQFSDSDEVLELEVLEDKVTFIYDDIMLGSLIPFKLSKDKVTKYGELIDTGDHYVGGPYELGQEGLVAIVLSRDGVKEDLKVCHVSKTSVGELTKRAL